MPILTLQHHALLNAFLKSTILTTVALCFGYLAGAVGHARVDASVLHGPLEEALAAKGESKRENCRLSWEQPPPPALTPRR